MKRKADFSFHLLGKNGHVSAKLNYYTCEQRNEWPTFKVLCIIEKKGKKPPPQSQTNSVSIFSSAKQRNSTTL